MDVTTAVKTEIKAWERDFRAQHGRSATVEDIKALPHIAEKYKLHKKLMKEAEVMNARERKAPKTPPRPKPKQSTLGVPSAAILSKPRPVTSSVNELSKNPFSPVKRKAGNATASPPSANPFLTPVKASRTCSPDLSSQNPGPSLVPVSAPSTAVSKARKRLHGEPVSPSPNPREKRRRLDALNSTGNPALASHSRSPSPPAEEGDSFVDDSPMKAPPSGKAFKPLFEEVSARAAMPPSFSQPSGRKIPIGDRSKAFARAKTLPVGLFGNAKKEGKARSSSSMDVFGDSTTSVNGTIGYAKREDKLKGQPGDIALNPRKKRLLPGPKGLIPSKDDLFETNLVAQASSSSALQPNTIAPRKRSLSAVTIDETNTRATSNTWGLLPPSPPPTDDNHWQKANGKGKVKVKTVGKGKSKKVKLAPAGSDGEMDGMSSEDAEIKTIAWRRRIHSSQLPDVDDTALVLDPELKFHLRRDEPPPPALPLPEKFEVDIPEDMLRVLALSPSDPVRGREVKDLVRDLMMGVRKGGVEIWRPGEVGGEGQESDEDVMADDWEGEGVPWEIAELEM